MPGRPTLLSVAIAAVCTALAAGVLVVAAAQPTLAHGGPTDSNPAADERVDTVDTVRLNFSSDVLGQGISVQVVSTDGTDYAGEPTLARATRVVVPPRSHARRLVYLRLARGQRRR